MARQHLSSAIVECFSSPYLKPEFRHSWRESYLASERLESHHQKAALYRPVLQAKRELVEMLFYLRAEGIGCEIILPWLFSKIVEVAPHRSGQLVDGAFEHLVPLDRGIKE